MEYIAIGLKQKINEKELAEVFAAAQKYNIKLVLDAQLNIDPEVSGGLRSFSESANLQNILLCTSNSTQKFGPTSNEISQGLEEFFFNVKNSDLLDFLTNCNDLFSDEYFLMFAFEWHKDDLIRYDRINYSQLKEYFKQNHNWHLWLYNYRKGFHQPDLDTPLVLNIISKQSPV
jgi:hypothetical protein